MTRRGNIVWTLSALLALVLLLVAALAWNEARKEVVFLCGNFSEGVTEASVVRQLQTGQFLRYRQEGTPGGSRIVVDSPYTLGLHRCTIELDAGGTVVRAGVGSADARQ